MLAIFDSADVEEEGVSFLSSLKDSSQIPALLRRIAEGDHDDFEGLFKELEKGSTLSKRELFMLLRIAISGRKSGPPLKELYRLIPRDSILKRIAWLEKRFSHAIKRLTNVKALFRRLSLRTQLLLILLFILLISISSLSIISARSEELIIDKVTDDLDDITKAIQISVEELTYRGDSTQRLKSYVDMLNRKGVKEISIISDDAQVIASSNPKKIGTTENPKKIAGQNKVGQKKNLIITAKLGEESRKEGQRLYNVIMPVSIKGQNLGYIHISMILDDYKFLQRRNHLKRILSTLFAFGIGIVASLILADQYTDPIKKIANASRKIAEGKLVKIPENERKDEIGVLVNKFQRDGREAGRKEGPRRKTKKDGAAFDDRPARLGHCPRDTQSPQLPLPLHRSHKGKARGRGDIGKRRYQQPPRQPEERALSRQRADTQFSFRGKADHPEQGMGKREALMQEALYMVADKVRDGIEITCVGPEEDIRIYCDREYMRMCLINLILNSAQAIEDKGTIVVTFAAGDGMTSISVTDNGKGMEGEDIDKIFEPYYSTKKLGIGLGLTITKRLVEEHAGTISAESIAGEKTVVTIKVPNAVS